MAPKGSEWGARGRSTNLQQTKRITDNDKRLLAILASDPSEADDYWQLAEMTMPTADGVRNMISELAGMGYRFAKVLERKPVKVRLIPSESSDSNRLR